MPGFTDGYELTVLAAALGSGDYIAWSTDGTTETSILARTAIGGWTIANGQASNTGALTSAAATGAGTVGYFAIYSTSTAGTQKTDWTSLTTPRTVATGDTLTIAAGAVVVALD